MPNKIAAFAVHLLTASGAAAAFLALIAAFERDFAIMFAWLGLALLIDGIDGPLARRADVARHADRIDGAALDLVVDFLTYVFVPVTALWRSGILPPAIAPWLCAAVVAASAMYFADRRMKLRDHWFRGFPALWNAAAVYLLMFRPAPLACALIVAALACLMFAPAAFVHPLRVKSLRLLTLAVTGVWLASAAAAIAGAPPSGAALAGLAVSGIYFAGLSLWRTFAHG